MSHTPKNIVPKNTKTFKPEKNQAIIAMMANGIPENFKTHKKSLSIESLTSSGLIHL